MTNEEAIKAIKANWPPQNYTMLRQALTMALDALGNDDSRRGCSYYDENNMKPCCTHDCYGCEWYR